MQQLPKEKVTDAIRSFRLPAYDEIPDVGLFLEQVTKYISDILAPLQDANLTSSMISNYVKKKLVTNPVKKQYDREQIAYLIFIAVAKTVLSLENIQLLIGLQKQSYTPKRAYEYFRREFENLLFWVFGLKETPDVVGVDHTEEKVMLRNTIMAVVHKVYLETYFAALTEAAKTEKTEE